MQPTNSISWRLVCSFPIGKKLPVLSVKLTIRAIASLSYVFCFLMVGAALCSLRGLYYFQKLSFLMEAPPPLCHPASQQGGGEEENILAGGAWRGLEVCWGFR